MADFLPLLETTKAKTRSIDICGVFRPIGLRRIAAGLCPRGAPRAALTLIQLKRHLFAEEARATGWGGRGRHRKLQGLLNSSEVPPLPGPAWIHHLCPPRPFLLLLLPQFTHVPASNKCSKK